MGTGEVHRAGDGLRSQGVAVVVLAAGQGKRLGGMGHAGPKWLAPVAGRPVAAYQLEAVRRALPAESPVLVVGGHRLDDLRRWLQDQAAGMRAELVENAQYAALNNWHSLLLATRRLDSLAWTGPTVVLNSDLCARPSWYEPFLAHVWSGPPSDGLLAIDLRRPLTDEAMKVSVDADMTCRRIGKVGVGDANGEYVGMAALTLKGRRLLTTALEEFVGDPDRRDAWYEAAFQVLMDRYELFRAWPTPTSDWVEIDDEEDWALATEVMARA